MMSDPVTDAQWAQMTKFLKLTDDARPAIDVALQMARGQRETWKRKPSLVKKRLGAVSQAASKLAKLIEGLDEQDLLELIEVWRPELGRRDSIVPYISTLAATCEDASAQVSKIGKTFRLDALIGHLAVIVKDCTGRSISQEKAILSFLEATCRIADRRFTSRAVLSAVKRFSARSKKRDDDSSKFVAVS